MNINDKLDNINNTKQEIKTAIEAKGQTVGDIPFAQYTDKIMAIETEGGQEDRGDSKSGLEVFDYTSEVPAQVNVSSESSAKGLIKYRVYIDSTNLNQYEIRAKNKYIRIDDIKPGSPEFAEAYFKENGKFDATFDKEVLEYGNLRLIHIIRNDESYTPDESYETLIEDLKFTSEPEIFEFYSAQVNASGNSQASGFHSQVNASVDSKASGFHSAQVNASDNSQASGIHSQVNASIDSKATFQLSQVNASRNSESNGGQVNASRSVLNDTIYSSAWGHGAFGADPSTANIKIHLLSESGDINHSGVLNSGHNFTDYAELFPNLTGEAQGYGLIQTIDGHGVRPANSGEQAVGVTSATAGVVLGETPFSWADRWLKDEWGALIYHDVLDNYWEPDELKGETEDDRPTITIPKENPEWNPEQEQIKRQDRPDEWTVVGLVGQVYVRLNENVEPMDYVKPDKDGVGQKSTEPTNIRVMKITQDFDENKGYKIGFCLLK